MSSRVDLYTQFERDGVLSGLQLGESWFSGAEMDLNFDTQKEDK